MAKAQPAVCGWPAWLMEVVHMEYEFSTERLLGIMQAWQQDARRIVDDIADWRDNDKLGEREWPEDRTGWLYLSTAEIVGWLSANHPLLDAQPLLTVHEYAQKWQVDGHARRLPPQSVIDSTWTAADLLVFSMRCGLAPCQSLVSPEPPVPKEPRRNTKEWVACQMLKEGRDHDAIAERLGIHVNAVSSYKARMMKRENYNKH